MSRSSKPTVRFNRWLRLQKQPTRVLGALVEERLLPVLEEQGFVRVTCTLIDPDWKESAYDLWLERVTGDRFDFVTVAMDNRGAPRFQVRCGTRHVSESFEWVRSANLIHRPGRFVHFWGKPWWRPYFTWTDGSSARTVTKVAALLPQVLRFLEDGHRGRNLSPP